MDKIDQLLARRIEAAYPSKSELEKKLRSGKKIRLYQGFDPTSPDLHIGHLVGLLTLRDFQQLGHEVIFLIGDFTGRIGDPTDKAQARVVLTQKQVEENAATYKKQVAPVLPFSGKNAAKVKYNSTWNEKLGFAGVIKLAKHLTVQQLIERDMFQDRLKNNKEIFLNEFLYPLVQGYDSVAMEVDLEVGGSDQMFNMMVGRKLVKEINGKEKFVVTTRLLADSNGKKIGKSEGNAVNLTNPPNVFFGQLMSLTDESIMPCLKLITDLPLAEVEKLEKEFGKTDNPMPLKKKLAFEVTKLIHGEKKAKKAQSEFEQVYQKKTGPTEFKPLKLTAKSANTIAVLAKSGQFKSNGQIKRLVAQGGVEVNGKKISSPIEHKVGDKIKAGKHLFFEIKEV